MQSYPTSRFIRHARVVLSAVVVATITLCAPLSVRAGEPPRVVRFVVPTSDQVVLRCEAGSAWYVVTTLNPEMVLGATGRGAAGYVQVLYPRGTPVVVKANEVEVHAESGIGTLSRRSRLRAFSSTNPVMEECFKAVFDEFLAPGLELRIIQPVLNLSGQAAGWLVEAPAGATGWVLETDLREASAEEAERIGQTAWVMDAPLLAGPAEFTPSIATSTTVRPVDGSDQGTRPAVSGQDRFGPSAVDQTAAYPETARRRAPDPGIHPTFDALDEEFDRVRRAPVETADETELLEQFRALRSRMLDEARPESEIIAVDQRIALLELRREMRATARAISRFGSRVAGVNSAYDESLRRIAQSREYLLVGRLLPSSLYDGQRAPLLYRLTSIDDGPARTLAYVTPEASLGLDRKIGSIVGILADEAPESGSEIGIIRPQVVDVLREEPESATAQAEQ